MRGSLLIRTELKEQFLSELTPSEKMFFLRKAREAIILHRYPVCEDLFHYCYFLTIRERFRGIGPGRDEGHLRFLLVEGVKETEEAIKLYRERLERNRLPIPDSRGERFIEFLSEQE